MTADPRSPRTEADPLVEAIAAAFAKHDPEEWGEGPLSDFIEEELAARGYRIEAAAPRSGEVEALRRALRDYVGDHDMHPAHMPDCSTCVALNGPAKGGWADAPPFVCPKCGKTQAEHESPNETYAEAAAPRSGEGLRDQCIFDFAFEGGSFGACQSCGSEKPHVRAAAPRSGEDEAYRRGFTDGRGAPPERGTVTQCPIEGVHEHAFRGPHGFREWLGAAAPREASEPTSSDPAP